MWVRSINGIGKRKKGKTARELYYFIPMKETVCSDGHPINNFIGESTTGEFRYLFDIIYANFSSASKHAPSFSYVKLLFDGLLHEHSVAFMNLTSQAATNSI